MIPLLITVSPSKTNHSSSVCIKIKYKTVDTVREKVDDEQRTAERGSSHVMKKECVGDVIT
jgi:hypothetical protein